MGDPAEAPLGPCGDRARDVFWTTFGLGAGFALVQMIFDLKTLQDGGWWGIVQAVNAAVSLAAAVVWAWASFQYRRRRRT